MADERVDRREMSYGDMDIQGKEDAIQYFLEALNTWVDCYGRFFGAMARASGVLRGRKSSPLLQY